MIKTLYEILELSRHAGPEAIQGAYERLNKKYSEILETNPNDADALNAIKAVKEAYWVLTTPERKERYDNYLDSIDPLPAEIEIKPFWTPLKMAASLGIALVSSLIYFNYHLAVVEKERQIAAEKRAEVEAQEQVTKLIAKQEEAALEQQLLEEQKKQELFAKFEQQLARTESQQIVQQQIRTEERQKQNAQRMAERLSQEAATTAKRQSMLERQRYESQRRQVEAEQMRQQRQAQYKSVQRQQPQPQVFDQRELERRRNEAKLNAMKVAQ